MKRTNLVLDADLLNEATRILGLKTYSATVNRALAEAIRVRRIQGLQAFFGSGLWEGDLAEMRDDRVSTQRARAQTRPRRRQ
jgi:Arc/MetJ family transcription regulator